MGIWHSQPKTILRGDKICIVNAQPDGKPKCFNFQQKNPITQRQSRQRETVLLRSLCKSRPWFTCLAALQRGDLTYDKNFSYDEKGTRDYTPEDFWPGMCAQLNKKNCASASKFQCGWNPDETSCGHVSKEEGGKTPTIWQNELDGDDFVWPPESQ